MDQRLGCTPRAVAWYALAVAITGVLAAPPTAYGATPGPETVTYSYDARGRLKTVTHTGGANDGVQSRYTYDKANNRKTVVTTGSPNPPPTP